MSKVLHIGRVVEVSGFLVVGELEASVDDLYRNFESRRYAVGQVGSIVKIEVGDRLVFGFVTGLKMSEAPMAPGAKSAASPMADTKRIEIELFGEGIRSGAGATNFSFKRGVETHPLPGQAIRITTAGELRQIYRKSDEASVEIGSLSQAAGLPVHLQVDDLLGKHFAVLGTTGSGKSCTTALVLRRILEAGPAAHVILIDPHAEYGGAFQDLAELIDPTTLQIPHWLLDFEESVELLVGRTEHAATSQTNILKDAILHAKRTFPGRTLPEAEISVDTPVPYKIQAVYDHIDAAKPNAASSQGPYLKIMNKIETLRQDRRYSFLITKDDEVADNLASLMSHLIRIPVGGKPISIIDLSGVPSEIVDVVVSIICRSIFDFALWGGRPVEVPILVVCEEAHRYAPRLEQAAFRGAKASLSRIAKEGRKYGVALGLISQRPSELDETILSQCNTLIALRMSNEADQHFVRRALPDAIQSVVNVLPALRSQEGLVVGEGAVVPFRAKFSDLPLAHQPSSHNVPFSELWAQDDKDAAYVAEVIDRWRKQERAH
jgi:DNA helicase HerA-like ATPase